MKQVFLSGGGEISVFEVPIPARLRDSILVRNHHSLISSGTEGKAVSRHRGLLGMYEKAVSSRERVSQVWAMARTQGVRHTAQAVQSKLQDQTPVGYSSAGTVVEVDCDSLPFQAGDRVACMGTGFASHAEFCVVPRNLAARVPPGVDLRQASFAALASIAMQGIRRLELTPGERIGVVGLGLIGQITIRLLGAMGYRPFGLDRLESRVSLAGRVANAEVLDTSQGDCQGRIMKLTGGQGLDGVVLCAATESDEPVNTAFDLCRKGGRVSIVGDVGLNLQRARMYAKEAEVRMSCSYGPGRHDPAYEIEGRDYSTAYVRWSEGRNLEHFLWLLHAGHLDLSDLVTHRFEIEDAVDAYRKVKEGDPSTLGVVLDYGDVPELEKARAEVKAGRTVAGGSPGASSDTGAVRLGIIGAGGYVRAMHLPNLMQLKNRFQVRAIASRSGASAAGAARRFDIPVVTSDVAAIVDDPEIEAVLIGTRHATHADLALRALEAGKHVFIEKPMATTESDCRRIVEAAESSGKVVRVGFNRRFSPQLNVLRDAIGGNTSMLLIRVNVGPLDDDWSNTSAEGGRLLGEGVHFYDLANWFMGAEPVRLAAAMAGDPTPTNPNASVVLTYPCGSQATVVYSDLGAKTMGKEWYEVFGGGVSGRVEDFRGARIWGAGGSSRKGRGDKGQRGCLEEFAAAVRGEQGAGPGADARAGLAATRIARSAVSVARQQPDFTDSDVTGKQT